MPDLIVCVRPTFFSNVGRTQRKQIVRFVADKSHRGIEADCLLRTTLDQLKIVLEYTAHFDGSFKYVMALADKVRKRQTVQQPDA